VNNRTIAATAKYLEIAKQAEMAPVTLAVAWSMNFDFIASTMIGARTADQLKDSLAALDVKLSDEVMQQCAAVQQEILYPMG
jgi:aryl-alcohol dehydrogenase-like predicted oxidoreductase